MTTEEYKPRFAFEITEEQKERAYHLLSTHGQRRATFSPILDDLLDLIEKHGQVICGLIADGRAKASDVIPVVAKAKAKAEKMDTP